MKSKVLPYIVLVLGLLQIALIFISWLITAAFPDLYIRSLLSSEGIRWFFGQFSRNAASPLLVWLLLISFAYGALIKSELLKNIYKIKRLEYRQQFAIRIVFAEILVVVLIMIGLIAIPHGLLLSVTGDLFPSSFSDSIIPVLAFTICTCSVTYGFISGILNNVKDVFYAFVCGAQSMCPLFVTYIFLIQLYFSICFVFYL